MDLNFDLQAIVLEHNPGNSVNRVSFVYSDMRTLPAVVTYRVG